MRRLASLLLLIAMASSGAYAVASPRVIDCVRIEVSVALREAVERRVETAGSEAPYRKRIVPLLPESRSLRAPDLPELYQRPPPAGH